MFAMQFPELEQIAGAERNLMLWPSLESQRSNQIEQCPWKNSPFEVTHITSAFPHLTDAQQHVH